MVGMRLFLRILRSGEWWLVLRRNRALRQTRKLRRMRLSTRTLQVKRHH